MLSSLQLMQLRLENNLLHFVNYEKKEKKKKKWRKQIIWKVQHLLIQKKFSNILQSKKTDSLQVSQNIVNV